MFSPLDSCVLTTYNLIIFNKETLETKLHSIAQKRAWFERETKYGIGDDCGGNYDDAYSMGTNDGEISLARELLANFFQDE